MQTILELDSAYDVDYDDYDSGGRHSRRRKQYDSDTIRVQTSWARMCE